MGHTYGNNGTIVCANTPSGGVSHHPQMKIKVGSYQVVISGAILLTMSFQLSVSGPDPGNGVDVGKICGCTQGTHKV